MRRAIAALVPMGLLAVACASAGQEDATSVTEPSAPPSSSTSSSSAAPTSSVPPLPESTAVPDAAPGGGLEISVGGVVRYGDAPRQFVELRTPEGDGPFPVIVFIHGGFWRNLYDASLAHPQAADAREHGYATWNVEYRSVGDEGGGYPGTLDDVAAAVDALALVDAPLDLDRVFVVGHSAGGHLALWIGQRDDPAVTPKLVVGQAPVADLANSLDLGRGAVIDFMGGTPDEIPAAYDVADPARRLPIKVPQLIIQGRGDDIVPLAYVQPYADASGADIVVFDDAGHFDVIDPDDPSWDAVLAWIADL